MTDSLKKAKTFFKELQNLCKQYQITIEIASGAGTVSKQPYFFFTDEATRRCWTIDQLRSDNILDKVKNWVE